MNNWQLKRGNGLNRIESWKLKVDLNVNGQQTPFLESENLKTSESEKGCEQWAMRFFLKLRNQWTSVEFVGKKNKPQISLIGTEDIWEELWTLSFELWALNFELWTLNFELWTLNFELWTLSFEPWTKVQKA